MDYFRILVVEDNLSLQWALKTGLEIYGFEVIMAANGIDALRQYEDHAGDFEAIVTDNDMPQMSGLEFVRSVRDTGFKGHIVVMSGNLTPENLRSYQDCEISGFFTKPFETSLLAAMLLHG